MDAIGTHRFENFVVGAANHLAVAAARAVAQQPGTTYNPLFLYSSSGLGKTHLLLAIEHLTTRVQPDLLVRYTTLDDFVEELHTAIEAGAMGTFKERYHAVSVLLLDDVQFLGARRETQSEMLRLFNMLQPRGKQIVLASDRPPGEIAELDERLLTRFSGGLIVDMGPPDYETRVAILRQKAEERGVRFNPGVMDEVARLEFTNVREMEGALNRLIACQTLGEVPVTAHNVRQFLGERPITLSGGMTAVREKADEFASFLHDVSAVVAQHIEPWRTRVSDAMREWGARGYRLGPLERLLDQTEPPDVPAAIAQYEQTIARLEALAREVAAVDPACAESDIFRDPDRLDEAEMLVARTIGELEPPPGPDPALTRAAFETGSSNQLAVHAASTIIEEPGRTYNPLFIHGPPGVGKTHLLHAIGNELVAMRGGAMRVACVNAETLLNELITALQDGSVDRWRARYRVLDALLLDDVQCIDSTERAQDEVFHIFNALHAAGRQVVVASDRAPRQLEGVEERLRSRFEGGLVVEIRPPDTALREQLSARYLAAAGVHPEQPLVEYLARRPAANVRDIIRIVERLVRAAAVVGVALTPSFARKELEGGSGSFPAIVPSTPAGRDDPFFLNREKVIWEWPGVSGRAIEELR
ncbi:MAG TPA: DnaA/Hda family protein [Gemmatimonadaceae bacterium]|nr:DnaA/Hda family protein [Gemmatimonadaceae bacterium]